ncbi:hypothetical protein EHI8A_111590 [Entamoeba histolytica HM-1:IMSS-B]|uniref:TLDc domain-containing protein n=6 Tax=Entamoeba histolytica TaxID=5759 RepID=B1N3Z9_ENTH1|nr:hypothetical protein EHI_060440 [Entamoeba histolytica HM-1:IMSS]EMD47443.1 Hypothetical protein EHI5A_033580 [Entamoeba histolytica KU27]EMH75899.1 hypothetical protein EHI8A_111590 [Entamoeba histolytica HM-1:IMSS-B]EMS16770.1 hypothetical protein KM1_044450 [Entamoeba histolytica HM-3:IMSS]ENY63521.1 hypothetical protein EHI7A_105050 [Entamoeba histolytica HM-1:IMSS-A]BAN40053.1 hypothetical protein [Entamoeba histolytica]|eukprot:XP_001913915.1 hypothetical protein EHI_060440 [Entamoeba histolytica HM-1:IMSS]
MFNRKSKKEKKDKSQIEEQIQKTIILEEELNQTKKELDESNKAVALLSSRVVRLENEYKQLHTIIDQIKSTGILEKKIELEPADVVLSKNFYDEYINQLSEWCGMKNHETLYDSDEDGLTARAFNYKTCGQIHTMTIVQTTDGCIFGSYNSIEIPDSKEKGYGFYMTKDDGFFCFILKSPLIKKPIKVVRKDPFYSTKVYSCDNDKWITGIHCGYYLGIEDSSFVSGKFSMYYNIEMENAVNIFSGNHFPDTFSVFKVVVLKWSPE